MTDAPRLLQLTRFLVDALSALGRDFALGGAFALAYWRTPRATVDIDVTV